MWAGTVQNRLADRRGPLTAAVLTAPLFALLHLPLHLGEPLASFAVSMTVLVALSVPFRIVAGWLYRRTGSSILLVAAFHTTFNAVNNGTLLTGGGGRSGLLTAIPWVVVSAWAAVLVAATVNGRVRGRRR